MANFDRVGLLALVSEYGGPRHNFQFRQSRKTVDDVFGNPVAQIFQIRIAAGINQRHDSDRMNSIVFGPLVSKEEIESYVDEHQNRYHESESRIVGLPYNQGRRFDRRLLASSEQSHRRPQHRRASQLLLRRHESRRIVAGLPDSPRQQTYIRVLARS